MSSSASLRGLQVFVTLGRTGSVNQTARALGVSSGAVSQQIKNLEAAIEVRLFERQGRLLVLTHWGRVYYEAIAQAFTQIEQADHILEQARAQDKITLSALTSVINQWLGKKIFDWQRNHPQVHIRIVGHEQEPRFGIDPVDFRLTYGKRVKSHTHYAKLFTDWVVPACSPALIRQNPPGKAGDILSYPLIHIEWEQEYQQPPQWIDWARSIGNEQPFPPPSLSFALASSAIEAAVSGGGFCLAQISLIRDELARGHLIVPFDIRLKLPESYFLAWHSAALEKPQARAFHHWLLHCAKRQAQWP